MSKTNLLGVLVTGAFMLALLILDIVYLGSEPRQTQINRSNEKEWVNSTAESTQQVIELMKHRFLTQGHCDIDTAKEGLVKKSFELRPPAEHAVLIVGGLRTFLDAWSSQWRTVAKLNDVDIYLYLKLSSNPSPSDCFSLFAPLATGRVRSIVVHRMDVGTALRLATREEQLSRNYPYSFIKGPDKSKVGMVVQYYFNFKAYQVYAAIKGEHRYKIVAKLRPDIYFGNPDNEVDFEVFSRRLTEKYGTRAASRFISITNCHHWGGLNDQYAIMDGQTADLYFDVIKHWDQYTQDGIRWHQETQLRHHLVTVNNVSYYPLEDVLGIAGTFEYCLRRSTVCIWCHQLRRNIDFPLESK